MGGKSAIHSLGERFGRLVVSDVRRDGGGSCVVEATCDCGGRWRGDISRLRSGSTKSCGCLSPEITTARNRTHGMSKTPEYRTWKSMKKRCYNEASPDYRLYGGRGVKVCGAWLNDFMQFYTDMGPMPSRKHSIDRIDSSGDYELGNCRWATPLQQARNTSRNVRHEYRGESKTMKEWCDELGLSYYVVKSRIADGWTVAAAFETEVKDIKQGVIYSAHGISDTVTGWSRRLGVGISTLLYRINNGWPLEAVFVAEKFK